MINRSVFTSLRRATLCVCLSLSLAAFSLTARADGPPKCSDPEVNEFLKKFYDLAEAEIAAVKGKDDAKAKDLDAKIDALMQANDGLQTKVSPDEKEAIGKFIMAEAQKLEDARAGK